VFVAGSIALCIESGKPGASLVDMFSSNTIEYEHHRTHGQLNPQEVMSIDGTHALEALLFLARAARIITTRFWSLKKKECQHSSKNLRLSASTGLSISDYQD